MPSVSLPVVEQTVNGAPLALPAQGQSQPKAWETSWAKSNGLDENSLLVSASECHQVMSAVELVLEPGDSRTFLPS